jgi:O-antigen/teichoic acid export membrane protein
VSEATTSAQEVDGVLSHLFGRGLLYTSVFLAQSAAVIVTTPVITRLLPVVGFGQVAAVNAVMIFVSAIVGLGLNLGVQQAFADFGESAARTIATGSCLAVALLTGAFLATIMWWAPWIGARDFETAIGLGVANAGLAAATLTLTSLLRSEERVVAFVVVGMTQAVGSQIIGVLALFLVRHNAVTYLAGLLVGGVLAFVLGLGVVRPRLVLETGVAMS